MATEYFRWPGKFKWAKIQLSQKDTKFNKAGVYSLNFYPEAEETWDEIRASGLRVQPKSDDDGEYVQLRRPHSTEIKGKDVEFGPPQVYLDPDRENLFKGFIGNGSRGVVNVAIFDTRNGKGHRLNSINITELVEYDPDNAGGYDPAKELPFDPND